MWTSPMHDVRSDTLSSGILQPTHLDYSWVHHRIMFLDAGDMLTYLILSSLPLPFSYWCTVSTLLLRFSIWYNIVTSLLSITENPREWFFIWSLQYFNIELNKCFALSWFYVLVVKQARSYQLYHLFEFSIVEQERERTDQLSSHIQLPKYKSAIERISTFNFPCFLLLNKSLFALHSQERKH